MIDFGYVGGQPATGDGHTQRRVIADPNGRAFIAPIGDAPDDEWVELGWIESDALTTVLGDEVEIRSFGSVEPIRYSAVHDGTRRDATERDGTRRDRPERPGTRRRMPTSADESRRDILDRIDDAVAQRCACGCNTVITDASPSAFYATAACQAAWMGAQATNPAEVYGRPDAAGYVGVDSAAWPLTPDPPARDPVPTAPAPLFIDSDAAVVVHEPGRALAGLAYLRRCHTCNDRREPRVLADGTDRFHECSHCGAPLHGDVYWPTIDVEERPAGWRLVLHCDIGRSVYYLTRRELRRCADPRALVDRIWHRLERDLERFRAAWHSSFRRPHLDAEARLAATVVDPNHLGRIITS